MKRTTTLMTGVATAALTVTAALPAFAAEMGHADGLFGVELPFRERR